MTAMNIVGIAAVLSLLAAPWYAAVAGRPLSDMAGVLVASGIVAVVSGFWTAGASARRARLAKSALEEAIRKSRGDTSGTGRGARS